MRALRPAILLAFLAALLVVMPAGASNTTTYQDSVGEGAGDPVFPDVTQIVVSNDDTGMITFRISIPSKPQFARDLMIQMFIDSDANANTGELGIGTDYALQLLLGEVALFKWDGANYSRTAGDPPATSLVYSWTGGVVTIRISATELGNTKAFGFVLAAFGGLVIDDITGNIDDTNAKIDIAPAAGSGLYRYEVKIAPARVVFKSLTKTPANPKAGKAFTVRMAATRSDTGAPIVNGQVDCKAKAGTKNVNPRSERFAGGRAVCIFTIPAKTTGKTLRGTITIIFEGKKLTRPFTAKIR
ncbi:MAG TPA: hypothetical protein VFR32_06620 [Gaiellaceae bacterium]|nr:hypothetical protein [Gaiellaceae bacterium]